ncbi:hypothetical protein E4U53_000871 [Claviceps sorghi]|nr:hypothetical protein E4U53_000871 [Claviceps sorghi]
MCSALSGSKDDARLSGRRRVAIPVMGPLLSRGHCDNAARQEGFRRVADDRDGAVSSLDNIQNPCHAERWEGGMARVDCEDAGVPDTLAGSARFSKRLGNEIKPRDAQK